MDAGASIIAFLSIGLQSVKVVYEFISAIKDGPSKLGDLQGAIESLESLLEQMYNSPGLTTSPITTSGSLLALVQRCVNDIQRFEAEIGRIYVPPKEKRCGKVWKRLKLAFKEKDIPYMTTVVTGHVNILSLHCNVRSMTTLRDMSLQQREIEQTMIKVASDVAAMSSSTAQADMVACQSEIHQTLTTMAPRVAEISTLSCRLDQLTQLCEQMNASIAHSPLHNNKMECRDQPGEVDAWSSGLSNHLNQLFELLGEERRTIPTSNAGDMIELIEDLLGSVRKSFLATSFTQEPLSATNVKTLSRQLKQLAAHFTNASSINVNLREMKDSIPSTGQVMGYESTETLIQSHHGSLAINKNIWRRSQSGRPGHKMSSAILWSKEKHTGITLLIRGRASSGMLLKAGVKEAFSPQWRGQFTLMPSISLYRTIPSNSEVFECVRTGRLDQFIQLLNNGKASLRDRDEVGASLLHYASEAGRREICVFLIDQGADIDDMASERHLQKSDKDFPATTPLGAIYGEIKVDGKCDLLQCYKLPLENGADPLLGEAASDSFHDYAPEFATAILTLAQPFMHINHKSMDGDSLLHYAVVNANFIKVKLLVDKGIDIDAVNDYGKTSLQQLLLFANCYPTWKEEFECIKYLIRQGANVHAIFNKRSCSAIAYQDNERPFPTYDSYAGDVWDAALAATGYNVHEFRESYPHRASYSGLTGRYTLQIFKELWEGMEDLCPYYAEATTANAGSEDDEWETESESASE
ncbi:hypothetical protein BDZ45DRAFT_720337 [Acephala macrosclerotiorum]|nr:hypothetical protein BDZ45DRAFT_720337 [Acephala macrosclerotiorum]